MLPKSPDTGFKTFPHGYRRERNGGNGVLHKDLSCADLASTVPGNLGAANLGFFDDFLF